MNAVVQSHTASRNNPAQQANQSTAEALLQVQGVSLEYRTPERVVRATHQVSFEIDPADRYVLLGPSGCGKSTLLKSIAGFIKPCEGEIRLLGQKVEQPGPDRIVVFQEFDQLPPWKTVKQNVMFPLLASKTLPRREAEERALHYLDKVGLAAFADAYPHTLSGGMKARVAIARALLHDPDILIMDEPTRGIDVGAKYDIYCLINQMVEQGKSVIMISSEMPEILGMCDRVYIMNEGKMAGELDAKEATQEGIMAHIMQNQKK